MLQAISNPLLGRRPITRTYLVHLVKRTQQMSSMNLHTNARTVPVNRFIRACQIPLKLDLSSGNRIWVLCKSGPHSEPPSHLSSPPYTFLNVFWEMSTFSFLTFWFVSHKVGREYIILGQACAVFSFGCLQSKHATLNLGWDPPNSLQRAWIPSFTFLWKAWDLNTHLNFIIDEYNYISEKDPK